MKSLSSYITVLLCLLYAVLAYAKTPNIDELEKQAMAGDPKAQLILGSLYDFGNGVQRSKEMAEKWYLMAAKQGYAEAQNSLGSGYLAEKRYEESRQWYEKAADQNHAEAINSLGLIHDLGLGVPQNRQKGFELYLKSANLGWAEAMWNIANMYGAGQLGSEDLYNACIWIFRAKKYSDKNIRLQNQLRPSFPYLKKSLGNEKFTSCQEEANKWSPNNNAP